MLWRWFPWRQVVRYMARSRGLMDPVKVLSRLESFGQPLEVKEPLELLRAGLVFHARGLLNTGAIQHNLDWVWPYWVERQYNPLDPAFIPRAFSLTHINLTHRNWTAVGIPDSEELPIVDPRGLLTPFLDGWSLDAWILTENGQCLLPSRAKAAEQRLDLSRGMAVVTRFTEGGLVLESRAEVGIRSGRPCCLLDLKARGDHPGRLVVALRPYNPEGVSFVHEILAEGGRDAWSMGKGGRVEFDPPADHFRFSDYRGGDVRTRLDEPASGETRGAECGIGMATAAALFDMGTGGRTVRVRIPLHRRPKTAPPPAILPAWPEALAPAAKARLPEERFQFLYDAAVRSLILHSPGEVYPGPYTYKRFWFRDAAFILNALLAIGLTGRVERTLDGFPARQKAGGFFFSQDGEWDSNGEALWILNRFCSLSGRSPKEGWLPAIRKGARWIARKRLPKEIGEEYRGLLPAGFSAEHLGPNDFYYWDDFWGVAGLRSAAEMLEKSGDVQTAARYLEEADDFLAVVHRSLERAARRLGRPGMPASPTRRLDSGAIGSLAAGYPLGLYPPNDPRLLDTASHLMENSLVDGGFFQDVIHSGINPYLTLHLAQVLLRAGDPRSLELFRTVADLASPTGQWPEAIHPRTGGGCMGDGHHVWASAEWVLMLRNCFVREEEHRLILGSGIFPAWLDQREPISFGPTLTPFGAVTLTLAPDRKRVRVEWGEKWIREPRVVEIRLPGFAPVEVDPSVFSLELERRSWH